MKKIFTLLIFILIIQIKLFSQCYNCNSNYPTSTQSISPGQTITVSTCVYGGEYSRYNVTSGVTYTWETCGDTDFDTQLTLFQGNTCGSGTVLAYNDDGCGLQSSITWTANFTGVVTLLVSKYNCQNQSTCMTLNWSASGGSGGGGGGATCLNADPFCTDSTYNFPAGVNSGSGEAGPDYCCLYSTPNPVWYYLLIDQPGNIEIYIHSSPQKDLDFICWGPFTNIDDPCMYPTTYLTNSGGCSSHHAPGAGGGYPSGNTVDCSYSASSEEWCYIPNAQTGQFYILLITNYSNQSCNIIFEQTNAGQPGAGSTNCNIVICNMSNITATPTACNPSTNLYSVSGTITFTDPPTSGQLIVTDNSGASQTFNPPFNSPINYTLTGLNSNGTTHTVTAQFTNAPSCTASITYNAPSACNMCNANAGPDKTVCGLSTNLEAVINPDNASYHWSPTAGISFANVNSPTTSITATAPGVYTLTWNVTSTYGVTCTDQVVITFDKPTVTATTSPSTICNGQTSVLTASGTDNYSWSTGGNTASITVTPSSTTTYTVTGTSTAGCTGTATVTVTVNPLPTVTASARPTAICNGQTSVLTASGTDNYSWSTGGNTASITVTPSSTTTYTVTGTSTAGCTGTATVSVTVNPLPTVTATASPSAICNGATSVLTASSDISGTTYSWSGTLGTGSTKTVTPTSTTTYTVTGTSTAGCTVTATVSVTVNPLPTVSATASPASICNGANSVLTAAGASTYSWSHSLGSGASKTVTPSSTTTYTVIGTSAAGCTGTATVSVTVNSLPTVSATASPTSICNGETSVLTASGTDNYSWSTGGTTASITVTPNVTTTYTVTGSSGVGCSNTATVTVTVGSSLTINYTTTQSHCGQSDGNIITNVTGGIPPYVYQWSNGANSENLINISAGNYNLTVTDANGCSSYISIMLTEAPMPQANFAPKPQITTIEDPIIYFENYSTGASFYEWDFGDGNISTEYSPTYSYTNPGEYHVILSVADEYGCIDTVGANIIIKEGANTFYIPNAFTPNGNDLNELFNITATNINPNTFEMRIYDRWGKQLFYTTDVNQGWDGTYKGEPVPQGIYTYIIKFEDSQGYKKEIVIGEVILLK